MPAPPENLMHMPLPRTDRKLPRHTLQSAMADRHKIMQERSRGNRNYENEDIRNNEQDEAQHRKCFFFFYGNSTRFRIMASPEGASRSHSLDAPH